MINMCHKKAGYYPKLSKFWKLVLPDKLSMYHNRP